MRLSWLLGALVLALILLVGHLFALSTYFYWHHLWFDIPMHILGGAALGAFVLGVSGTRNPVLYVLAMLTIVLGWEVFEYLFSISTGQSNYWVDTATDLLNGLIGAALTYGASIYLWRSA